MKISSARALLAELRERGISIEADGDRIRFFPLEATTPGLRKRIAKQKAALLRILRDEGHPVTTRSMPAREELVAVERRLAALLEGRLWKDSAGWWPKDTGLAPSRAAQIASEAMVKPPPTDLPEAKPMTVARGPAATRAWAQVVACLMAEFSWSFERAGPVAALVVDFCFALDPCREVELEPAGDDDDFEALYERYFDRLTESMLCGEYGDTAEDPQDEVPITAEMFEGGSSSKRSSARPPKRCFNCRRSAGWWRAKGDPGPWHCQWCVPQAPRPDLDTWPAGKSGAESQG